MHEDTTSRVWHGYLRALSVLLVAVLIAATVRDVLDGQHDGLFRYWGRFIMVLAVSYGLYRRRRWTKYAVGLIASFIVFVCLGHAFLNWSEVIREIGAYALLLAGAAFASLILLCPSRCFGRPKSEDRADAERLNHSNMYLLLRAARSYRVVHGGWPDSLEQIAEHDGSVNGAMTNPITGDVPGYEYEEPALDADGVRTGIIYQLRDGKRDLALDVGHVDGEIHPGPLANGLQYDSSNPYASPFAD